MEDSFDKQYYKIKDVAEMLDVQQSTLRYWEKEFPQCKPVRSPHNIRYYKARDIRTLQIIKFLVKDKGLKIEAAKEQLRLNVNNVSRRMDVIERLEGVKTELKGLLKALKKRDSTTENEEDEISD